MRDRRWNALVRLPGIVGALLFLTLGCAYVLRLNAPTAGFVYLVATLLVATTWGLPEAVTASVVGTICYNFFFLPPIHTLRIADQQNWVALLTFLVASLVTSQLSERAKRRTAEAVARQQELERLHAVSRAILLSSSGESLGNTLVSEMARAYGAAAAAIYDRTTGETFQTHGVPPKVEQKLRRAATDGGAFKDETEQTLVVAFGLGNKPMGSLGLVGALVSDEALQSLANLVALGLEKARNQDAANRAEAARQTQEFKSTLLDALAHEFKTPLTTITAAATAMVTPGMADTANYRELAAVIEQDAGRLAALVTEVLHLARIKAGKLRLERQSCDLPQLIGAARKQMEGTLAGRTVNVSTSGPVPAVPVDVELMQIVLRHLLDNAVKYSPPDSPLRVQVSHAGGCVRINVWNESEAIPEWERPRLFEKFYRGTTAGPETTGTGMGLAIAKEIVQAHGGDVRLESSPDGGTEVSILLPADTGVAA